MISVLIFLPAIAVAEAITVYVHPVWGISCHVVVFISLIIYSAVLQDRTTQRIVLSLSLAPLVRIISLSIPLGKIPEIWRYPIIYVPLLTAALIALRLLHMGRREIGISTGFIPTQLGIALTGVGFGVIEYFILKPAPLIKELSWQSTWLPSLIFLLTVGFVEELIFRGVIQRSMTLSFGWKGIIYVSLLFALLYMGFFSWLDIILVFWIAVFFGWAVYKTGSLLGVTLSHGLTNIMLYLVVPFLLG